MTANNNVSPCEVCNDLLDIRNHMDMANAAAMAMHEIFFERLYDNEDSADHRRKMHEFMTNMFRVLHDQIFNLNQEIGEKERKYDSLHEAVTAWNNRA